MARPGAEALVVWQTFVPDVAIVDERMPQMSGLELAMSIRRMSELPRIWLIALSGYGSGNDITNAEAAGFDEYLTKPVEISGLVAAIERG